METVAGVVALTGSVLIALAGIGVIRFGDLYARMHAATKASTLGIVLIAVAAALAIDGAASKVLLAAAAIFVTAPSAAHLIGRGSYRAEGVQIRLQGHDDLLDTLQDATDADDAIALGDPGEGDGENRTET